MVPGWWRFRDLFQRAGGGSVIFAVSLFRWEMPLNLRLWLQASVNGQRLSHCCRCPQGREIFLFHQLRAMPSCPLQEIPSAQLLPKSAQLVILRCTWRDLNLESDTSFTLESKQRFL